VIEVEAGDDGVGLAGRRPVQGEDVGRRLARLDPEAGLVLVGSTGPLAL